MISKLLDLYALLFAKKRLAKFNKLIFMIGARGLGILNYKNPYLSGEEPFLAKFLAKYDSGDRIVLDVGANKGQFASWVLRNTREVQIRSYEPNMHACSMLKNDPSLNSGRHKLVEMGASNKTCKAVIFDYADQVGSEHSSLYSEVISDIHGSQSVSSMDIRLVSLDDDLRELKEQIALLKIDTEGHEKDVLEGATRILADNPPAAILVEFNEMNVISGTHYADLKKLIGKDYAAYRLLPGGGLLPLDDLSPLLTEICAYQNLVFVRQRV